MRNTHLHMHMLISNFKCLALHFSAFSINLKSYYRYRSTMSQSFLMLHHYYDAPTFKTNVPHLVGNVLLVKCLLLLYQG